MPGEILQFITEDRYCRASYIFRSRNNTPTLALVDPLISLCNHFSTISVALNAGIFDEEIEGQRNREKVISVPLLLPYHATFLIIQLRNPSRGPRHEF
jgi:hypothetical protein